MRWPQTGLLKRCLDSFARYGGVVAISFEWLAVGLFYVLRPSEFTGEHAISYFASLPETRVVFSVCLTIAALSFWIFTRYHLPKYYVVPVRIFSISMLGYGVLALMPYDPSNPVSSGVHNLIASIFSASFLAGMYLIGKNSKDSSVKAVSYLATILSGFVTLLFVVFYAGTQFALLFEAVGAFIGQIWVVWISFHSFKAESRNKLRA